MECLLQSEEGNSKLLEYAAGRLLGRKSHEVRVHLRDCPDCARFVFDQSAIWDLLETWDAPPVSMTFNRNLYARIHRSGSWVASLARAFNAMVARPALPLAALSLLMIAGFYAHRPQVPVGGANASVEATPAVSPIEAEELSDALHDLQLLHQLDSVKGDASSASRGM